MERGITDALFPVADGVLTIGKTGIVVALALLVGEEVDGPTLNLFEYSKVSQKRNTLVELLTCCRGRPIRILRGSNLKSKYAPQAGVRYDGL